MKISMIACMSRNRVIGKDGQMPWHISDDLKRFKIITSNRVIVMGRKTFESLGCRPLPERINIVLSESLDRNRYGSAIVCRNRHELLDYIKSIDHVPPPFADEIMIIGGESVYKEFMPIADRLYMTIIDHDYEGDTYFPEIEPADWNLTSCKTAHDDKFPHNFAYITLDRVKQ